MTLPSLVHSYTILLCLFWATSSSACAQKSLLVIFLGWKNRIECWGLNPGWLQAKQAMLWLWSHTILFI